MGEFACCDYLEYFCGKNLTYVLCLRMRVLKFGGTSVGTVPAILSLKKIVEARTEPTVVVVSALGGLTDQLIDTAMQAACGVDHSERVRAMRTRHHEMIEAVVQPAKKAAVLKVVDGLMDELHQIYARIGRNPEERENLMDEVVAHGEMMSSEIVAAMISNARRLDALDFMRTRRRAGGRNVLDSELTRSLITRCFADGEILKDSPVVVPGFISRDADDLSLTNLGRGGSDFTGALIAAALGADVLEIWTDVDGFMTADPRLIPNAMVLDRMSMVEAMELCNYGAKVIYPPTIYPVFNAGIPIIIKNTFNPQAPGTYICDTDNEATDAELPIKGVTAIKDTELVVVEGRPDSGLNAHIFNAMGRHGIDVFMAVTLANNGIGFVVKGSDADRTNKILDEEFAIESATGLISGIRRERSVATVAIVGRHIRGMQGLEERLLRVLAAAGLQPVEGATAISETSFSLVVPMDKLQQVMTLLHNALFVPKPARPRLNPNLFAEP